MNRNVHIDIECNATCSPARDKTDPPLAAMEPPVGLLTGEEMLSLFTHSST
jgi:hypothetical protein